MWCEWRNCGDEEYARHMFDPLVKASFDQHAVIILGTIGAMLGIIGGGLYRLLISVGVRSAGGLVWSLTLLAGAIVGAGLGAATAWGLRRNQRTQWGDWLHGFIPGRLGAPPRPRLNIHSWYFILALSLSSGLGLGITGLLFFGQTNRQFYSLAPTLAVVWLLGPLWDTRVRITHLLVGAVAGFAFGLLFGLGAAQVVGGLVGPMDVANSARAVGLFVGLGAGLYAGRQAGPIALMVILAVLAGLVLPMGFNLVLLGWLFGLTAGGLGGSFSRWWPSGSSLGFAEAYAYRWAYLWWAGRPPATQVEAALRSTGVQQELLKRLDQCRKRLKSPEKLITDLRADSWQDRFVAWHSLVTLGGEVMPKLAEMLEDQWTGGLHPTLRWLIRSFGYETTARLAGEPERWICPDCLTVCGAHGVRHRRWHVAYYGCRNCRRSRDLLDCYHGVVAVLDTHWGLPFGYRDQLLRVNVLERTGLFDFTQVEIVRASDEEVERFAVRIGNDTDSYREPRYKRMRCMTNPACHLSENTLRILDSIFGQVEHRRQTNGGL
jgi:hypothetical protein